MTRQRERLRDEPQIIEAPPEAEIERDDSYQWDQPWRRAAFDLTTIEAKERLDRYRAHRHPNLEAVADLVAAVRWLRESAGLGQTRALLVGLVEQLEDRRKYNPGRNASPFSPYRR